MTAQHLQSLFSGGHWDIRVHTQVCCIWSIFLSHLTGGKDMWQGCNLIFHEVHQLFHFYRDFLAHFSLEKQWEDCHININVSTVSVDLIHMRPRLLNPRSLLICTFWASTPSNYLYAHPPFSANLLAFHQFPRRPVTLQVFKIMIQHSEVRTQPLHSMYTAPIWTSERAFEGTCLLVLIFLWIAKDNLFWAQHALGKLRL